MSARTLLRLQRRTVGNYVALLVVAVLNTAWKVWRDDIDGARVWIAVAIVALILGLYAYMDLRWLRRETGQHEWERP